MISMITKEQYKRLREIENELYEIQHEISKTQDGKNYLSEDYLKRMQILSAVQNISDILPPWDI